MPWYSSSCEMENNFYIKRCTLCTLCSFIFRVFLIITGLRYLICYLNVVSSTFSLFFHGLDELKLFIRLNPWPRVCDEKQLLLPGFFCWVFPILGKIMLKCTVLKLMKKKDSKSRTLVFINSHWNNPHNPFEDFYYTGFLNV